MAILPLGQTGGLLTCSRVSTLRPQSTSRSPPALTCILYSSSRHMHVCGGECCHYHRHCSGRHTRPSRTPNSSLASSCIQHVSKDDVM